MRAAQLALVFGSFSAALNAALPAYRPAASVQGELVCAGGDTLQSLVETWGREFQTVQPAAHIVVDRQAKLAADGFAQLLAGRAQIVTFVREPFLSEQAAFQQRFGYPLRLIAIGGGSFATKSGTHALAIYVNAANPISRLDLTQLDAIFSRTDRRGGAPITRWGQLGLTGDWADRPIVRYGMLQRRGTGNPPGIVNYFSRRVLLGGDFESQVAECVDRPGETALDAIVARVASNLGAIGYSGFAYARPGAKAVELAEAPGEPACAGTESTVSSGQYPLSRQIYFGVNQPEGPRSSPLLREFVNFVLSREGQAAYAADRMHFLPLSGVEAAIGNRAIPVVGYNDMQRMLEALNVLFGCAHPAAQWALNLKGTRTAPAALARGDSLFAPMGAEFSPAELAQYRSVACSDPVMIRVAHASLNPTALSGPIGIFVHRSNPLAALTTAQVAIIFTSGAPLTWSACGLTGDWAGQPVHPCGLSPSTALGIFMSRRAFGGRPLSASLAGFSQSAAVVRSVSADPDAIGFAAANRGGPGVKLLAVAPSASLPAISCTAESVQAGRYPYDRHLLIYLRRGRNGRLDPLAVAYVKLALSPPGQAAIAAGPLGYLPLNRAELASELARLH